MKSVRVMLVRRGAAIEGVVVRCAASGEDWAWRTDQDGQVEIKAPDGPVTLEFELDEGRITHQIGEEDRERLNVVDLDKITSPVAPITHPVLGGVTNQRLGERYVFDSVLGRGGMGVVVRAQDTLLDRVVAIKMLNDEFLDDTEIQEMFLREARNLAVVSHPNLVSIHDVTMIEGRAMIVFEYVRGQNLEDLVFRQGAFAPGEVMRVGIQLARALAHLHHQGVIHRDLKPANALVQEDGCVRMIDFGLARSLEQIQARGTRVRGTPAYMAPEQLQGHVLTPAVDIYQFGVSMFELAAGELPFGDDATGYSHVHELPPTLQSKAPHVPVELSDVIGACLAKDPAVRPTAEELAELLGQLYQQRIAHYDAQATLVPVHLELFGSITRDYRLSQVSGDPSAAAASMAARASSPRHGARPRVLIAALVLVLFSLGGILAYSLSNRSKSVSLDSTESAATPVVADAPAVVSPEPKAPVKVEPKVEGAASVESPPVPTPEPTPKVEHRETPEVAAKPKRRRKTSRKASREVAEAPEAVPKTTPEVVDPPAALPAPAPVDPTPVTPAPTPAVVVTPKKEVPVAKTTRTVKKRVIRKKVTPKKKTSNPSPMRSF